MACRSLSGCGLWSDSWPSSNPSWQWSKSSWNPSQLQFMSNPAGTGSQQETLLFVHWEILKGTHTQLQSLSSTAHKQTCWPRNLSGNPRTHWLPPVCLEAGKPTFIWQQNLKWNYDSAPNPTSHIHEQFSSPRHPSWDKTTHAPRAPLYWTKSWKQSHLPRDQTRWMPT